MDLKKLKVLSPQDDKDLLSEKEKKMRAEITQQVEDEFYNHANLARLFTDPMEITGISQYIPWVSAIVSIIVLIVVILK